MTKSPVRDKSYSFALEIVRFYRHLVRQKEFVLSKQLLRSGTSIGANVEEAAAGQSRADFLSKMSIASKEAREANYWLRLIRDAGIVEGSKVEGLLADSEELVRLLTAIVKSTSSAK